MIPCYRVRSRPKPKWFNGEINHILNRIHSLRRLLKRKYSSHLQNKLLNLEEELQDLIQAAKCKYISGLCRRFFQEPKKLFRYLKDLRSATQSIPIIIQDAAVIRDPSAIAECYNNFFNSTFTRSNFKLPAVEDLPTPANQLSSISLDPSDVFEALCKLNCDKAMGVDGISPRVLKGCATALLEPLTYLFQLCLNSTSIPDEWKIHKIKPLPKKGDLTLACNYRPISLLCIVSKMMESIVYKKIIDFVEPKLNKKQFGFLAGRSCVQQLLRCFDEIFDNADLGSPTDVVYLDLRKAFDSVPHDELLLKLWRLGITGDLWKWFKAYLAHRQHFVSLLNESSPMLPVLSGVPQGSVLGPLLFLIYINDIPDSIEFASIYLFADDAKLLKAIASSMDELQVDNDLQAFNTWGNDWLVRLNALKCMSVRFGGGGSSDPHIYELQGDALQSTTTCRDLGVTVCSDLTWSAHINNICSSAYRSLNLIRRNTPASLSIQLKKSLYLSLVRSHLSYCSQLWRPYLVKDFTKLEKVQRRATRFLIDYLPGDYKARLIELNLLPLMYWLEIADVLFFMKSLRGQNDSFNVLDYVAFTSSRTRSGNRKKLQHKYCRTTKRRNFFFHRIVRLWNALPVLDTNLSLPALKFHLAKFFWNHFLTHFDVNNTCTYHFVCPCSTCIQLHST